MWSGIVGRLSCRNWKSKNSGGSAVHYRFHMTPQPETLAQWEERTSLACEDISSNLMCFSDL